MLKIILLPFVSCLMTWEPLHVVRRPIPKHFYCRFMVIFSKQKASKKNNSGTKKCFKVTSQTHSCLECDWWYKKQKEDITRCRLKEVRSGSAIIVTMWVALWILTTQNSNNEKLGELLSVKRLLIAFICLKLVFKTYIIQVFSLRTGLFCLPSTKQIQVCPESVNPIDCEAE